MGLKKKEQVVLKIAKILESSLSAVVASLEGITSNELTNLRMICRKNGVYICVIRNTLMHRAFKGTVFECLCPIFFGSNIIAFSTVEASDCARIFVEFAKERYEKFKIKGAAFNGMLIEESNITFLSSLPTYKDCIIKLMFILKESAIGKFIRLLHVYALSSR